MYLFLAAFLFLDPGMIERPMTYCDRYHEGYFAGACPFNNVCNIIPPLCEKDSDPSAENAYRRGWRDGEHDRIYNTIVEITDGQETNY